MLLFLLATCGPCPETNCIIFFIESWIVIDRTGYFLLVVVVVTGGEELSEDKGWNKDLLYLVLHHRDPLPVVPHTDQVVLTGTPKNNI